MEEVTGKDEEEIPALAVMPVLIHVMGSEEKAMLVVRAMALEVCGNDPERLGKDGLPRDSADFFKLQERLGRLEALVRLKANSTMVQGTKKVETLGQQDPAQMVPGNSRGRIEDVLDQDDPLIGSYVRDLVETTTQLGVPTDALLNERHAVDNKETRREILIKCIQIARDMILSIGPERFDAVKPHIRSPFHHRYWTTEEILTLPAEELAQNAMTNHEKGYWNAIPRVWVEDLMLLAKNPALIDKILALFEAGRGQSTPLRVRQWIKHFAEVDRPRVGVIDVRMSETDYVLRNLKRHNFPMSDALEILERIVKVRSTFDDNPDMGGVTYAEAYGIPGGKPKKQKLGMSAARALQLKALSAALKEGNPEKNKSLLKKILTLASIISRLDEGYRAGGVAAVDPDTLLSTDDRFKSVRAALRDCVSMNNRFDEQAHSTPGGVTYRIKHIPYKDANDQIIPKLEVEQPAPGGFKKKIIDGLPEAEAMEMCRNLLGEEGAKIASVLFRTVKKEQFGRRRAYHNAIFRNLRKDQLFAIYSVLRYLNVVLPKLMEKEFNELKEDPSVIADLTAKNALGVLGRVDGSS